LADYCDDDLDILVIGFLNEIKNNKPILNFSSHCGTMFPDNSTLKCPEIEADILACQQKGKVVILSIGGANGDQSLADAAAGKAFAQTVWDMFLGGTSPTRPFGNATVDGVDLDLERGETSNYSGYSAFIEDLRAKFAQSPQRPYYITSAPQCPFPDKSLNPILTTSWMDMVFVQFYNNPSCAPGSPDFNFKTWNEWATTKSANKDVRIYLGVPGGPGAAGSGVLDATGLTSAINIAMTNASFGGVMMWDAGRARASGLAKLAAGILHGSSATNGTAPPPSASSSAASGAPTSASAAPTSGSAAPTSGSAAPTSGSSVPTSGSAAPTSGSAAPTSTSGTAAPTSAATTATPTKAATSGTGSTTAAATGTSAAPSQATVPTTVMPMPTPNGPVPTITIRGRAGQVSKLAVQLVQGQPASPATTNTPAPAKARAIRLGGNLIVSRPQVEKDRTRVIYADEGEDHHHHHLHTRRLFDPRAPAQGASFVIEAVCT
jgi:chitinase